MGPRRTKMHIGVLLAFLAATATVTLGAVAFPRDYSIGESATAAAVGGSEGERAVPELLDEEDKEVEVKKVKKNKSKSKVKQPSTPPAHQDSDKFANYTYRGTYSPPRMQTSSPNATTDGRTIIVGDIHGTLVGFNSLLDELKFDSSKDGLILAGDIVAKGAQSLEVIDKARELGARCVRGNHDDKVLRWKGYLNSLKKTTDPSEKETLKDLPGDLVENSQHHQIAEAMNEDQYQYLLSCPLILSLPSRLSVNKVPIYVIHAGIDPSRSISNQLPWVLTNIRNVLEDGTPSRKRKHGEGWSDVFNELQSSEDSKESQRFMVVYGHDAGRSLNVKTWTVGIDTKCVSGGSLTGYVVETGKIISVECPDQGDSEDD